MKSNCKIHSECLVTERTHSVNIMFLFKNFTIYRLSVAIVFRARSQKMIKFRNDKPNLQVCQLRPHFFIRNLSENMDNQGLQGTSNFQAVWHWSIQENLIWCDIIHHYHEMFIAPPAKLRLKPNTKYLFQSFKPVLSVVPPGG